MTGGARDKLVAEFPIIIDRLEESMPSTEASLKKFKAIFADCASLTPEALRRTFDAPADFVAACS